MKDKTLKQRFEQIVEYLPFEAKTSIDRESPVGNEPFIALVSNGAPSKSLNDSPTATVQVKLWPEKAKISWVGGEKVIEKSKYEGIVSVEMMVNVFKSEKMNRLEEMRYRARARFRRQKNK